MNKVNTKNVNLSNLTSDSSLRNDFKYSIYKIEHKGTIGVSELFDVISLPTIDVEELETFKYCQIGDVNNNGDVFPVTINLNEEDLSLVDYYKKIRKGDICKPQKGDILISKVRPYLKKFVFIDENNEDIYFTSAFICLRPKYKPLVLYYMLRNYLFSFLNSVSRQGKGYPTLTNDDIKALKIEKSFLEKAYKFDKETFILKKHNEIKTLQKGLRNKLLIVNDVFSSYFKFDKADYLKIQKGWTFGTQNSSPATLRTNNVSFSSLPYSFNVRLSCRSQNQVIKEINEKIKNGAFIKVKNILTEPIHRGSSPSYSEDGIPVIKIAHLKSEEINKDFTQFVETANDRSKIRKGDILLASTGKPSIGKIDLVKDDDLCVVDGHVSIIRIDPEKYNRQFFVYLFRSIYGYAQLERDVVGCTNQVELYPDDIGEFLIPEIDLDSQNAIVSSIDKENEHQNSIISDIDSVRSEIDNCIYSFFERND